VQYNYYHHQYYYNSLTAPWTLSATTRESWYHKDKTRKVKPIGIYCSKRHWVEVSSAWPYANLHFALDR